MTDQRRLILSGVISVAIHAYLVTAAAPWIDPPRLKSPSRITLTVVKTSLPQPEPDEDDEPPTPAEDQPEAPLTDEPIKLENTPAQTANAAPETRRREAKPTQPDKPTPKAALDRNTRPKKSRIAAAKVEKSKKPPRRAPAKPQRQKQKSKAAAKARPTARERTDKKGISKTKKQKSPSKAGSSSKAAGGKIRKPIPRANPRPPYPRSARRRGLEGTVTLEVLVNTRGRVEQCRVRKSSGHRTLDEQALKTVRKWTFQPGSKGGTPAAMWVKAPIRFKLK